ncbi:MAG: nickel-responsive transcriptional regulator NikR [Candidatus Thermoplasmatota archaeon]
MGSTMTVARVGVSLDPALLEKFDSLIKEKGYPSRSEAIGDLLRRAVAEEALETGTGEAIGTLTILYDHHVRGVTERLLHLQHHHISEILSTTHIHVDERSCLEVLIVRGSVRRVKRLAARIAALKGVRHGELVVTPTTT